MNHIGKQTSVLDPMRVSFARARQLFRSHWKNLRSLQGVSPKEYLRLLVGFNPFTIFVWGAIESRRYSPSLVWRGLVSAKDYAWALSTRAKLPLRYARQRSKVRKLRRGARHFDAADARFNRYLEVRSDASLGTGFFTQFLIVLNQLHFARAHRLEPVINQDHSYHPHFEKGRGSSVWEYYFETASETSLDDLRDVDPGSISLIDPSRQLSLTLGDSPAEPADPEEAEAWLRRLRSRGADLVERFVRVRPEVMARVSELESSRWGAAPVLGIHLRGTNRGRGLAGSTRCRRRTCVACPGPAGLPAYVDLFLEAHPDALLFVATDQQQFLDHLVSRYGDRATFSDSARSTDHRPPVAVSDDGPYELGLQVLQDCLLLSRSSMLLRCASNVGEIASYFDRDLPVVDLSREPDIREVDFDSVRQRRPSE